MSIDAHGLARLYVAGHGPLAEAAWRKVRTDPEHPRHGNFTGRTAVSPGRGTGHV